VNGYRFRAVRADEVPLAAEHGHEAFGGDPATRHEREAVYRRHLAAGELWGVEDSDGALVGHCRLLTVDHFFGGRAVTCMDVAGVAVPAALHRRGIGTALMEGAAAWGAHRGLALSLLYGYVPQLYRPLGWEQAGALPEYRLDPGLQVPAAEAMRPARPDDWTAIVACHDRFAQTVHGAGRRTGYRWSRLRDAEAFVLPGGRGLDAVVLIERDDDSPTADWAAVTGRGVRAVLALLTELAAKDDGLVVHSPPDAWAPWTQRWDIPAGAGRYWMARPLLLTAGVASRGFPAAVTAEVTLEVADPLVAENRGAWRLSVGGGRGRLTPAPTADVLLDVRAWGPLFTGFLTPSQLARAGLVDGPDGALADLAAAFAGPPPVMLDFF